MDKNEFYANARHDLTGPLAGVRVVMVLEALAASTTTHYMHIQPTTEHCG